MKVYMVCDATDNDIPVYIGNSQEVANYIGTSVKTIYCQVVRQNIVKKKYHIVSVDVEGEE